MSLIAFAVCSGTSHQSYDEKTKDERWLERALANLQSPQGWAGEFSDFNASMGLAGTFNDVLSVSPQVSAERTPTLGATLPLP